ncbi:MAG: VWA domain-containing protein [Candidatus Riflebacteria bacterium]|nr:VWA domain-containing protein [Candidatus Riflebacteria bacterium]
MNSVINIFNFVTPDNIDLINGLRSAKDKAPVPLLGVRANGQLHGLIIEWQITQRYRNIERKPIEAIYSFPLPEEAAVCGLQVRIGDKVFKGDIEGREAAFKRYDKAMADGNGAYLLDAERPNFFQMSVGNLLPEQEVEIEIRFLVLAKNVERRIRLALPTTISPRYTTDKLPTDVRAEIDRITPPYADAVPYGLSLSLDAEFASSVKVIESPSHPIRSEMAGKHAKISFSQIEVALDRDVVLIFEVAEPNLAGATVGAWKGRDHVLVELIPELDEKASMTPRSVTFLLDCSGSMRGDSIDQSRRAVELCLRSLSEGDTFQIMCFGSKVCKRYRKPRSYTQANLDEAVECVRNIQADLGGTEILPALECLFADKSPANTFIDLVVLTDGQVSNEDQVLEWAKNNRHRCRIFAFGIGAGASDFLVKGLARESSGEAEFIYPGERVEPKVLRQFARLHTPVLKDVSIDWGGLKVEAAPAEIPPVFAGEPLQLAARLPPGKAFVEGAEIRLTGTDSVRDYAWIANVRHVGENGAFARWWARLAIRDLESDFCVARVGSNQRRYGKSNARKKKLIALSTEYSILSAETSFVIDEERSAKKRTQKQAVLRRIPVAITVGWHGRRGIQPGIASLTPGRPRIRASVSGFDDRTTPCFCISRESKFNVAASKTVIPWYIELIQEARANGSFILSQTLAKTLGISMAELRIWAASIVVDASHEDDRETIMATTLATIILTQRASAEQSMWNPVHKKAMCWLNGTRASGPGGISLLEWAEGKLIPGGANTNAKERGE